jgi:ABC-type uncharacterized transport system ATPase subunit
VTGTEPPDAVRMRGIVRTFGPVPALQEADFGLVAGEIHALLGENGAGKSTLMQILFGLVTANRGTVEVFGRPLPAGSPRAAMAAGIGMVHQHFSQVPRMTVAENVWLGGPGVRYRRGEAEAAVRRVGEDTGLALDPAAYAGNLPAGLRQRLEIVKALAHEVRVLILDEPTAALAPSEVADLFAALRRLTASGLGVVLITHKLREVAAVADRVTVLRKGRVVASGPARDFTEAGLAAAMIGESPAPTELDTVLERPSAPATGARRIAPVLEVHNLVVRRPKTELAAVAGVSLEVQAHEIIGIAGVEGNGQRELMRAIAGLQPCTGRVTIGHGGSVGFVPEDRQREGLILDFTITENLALAASHGFWLKPKFLEGQAAVAIEEYRIRTPGPRAPVRALSGGNQQKVVLARVLDRRPALLVAENPTRGLDIRATAEVHERLRRAARDDGLGVLFYSTDLDEVIALSDRIGVMVAGHWQWVPEQGRTRERIGALMLGAAA